MAEPRKTPANKSTPQRTAKKAQSRKAPAKKAAARKRAAASDGRPEGGAPLREVVLRSAGELQELIGQQPEGVVAVERDNGEWKVQIEVVESHRIPETTDILAIYELVADRFGELLSYRRLNRYVRGHFEE